MNTPSGNSHVSYEPRTLENAKHFRVYGARSINNVMILVVK